MNENPPAAAKNIFYRLRGLYMAPLVIVSALIITFPHYGARFIGPRRLTGVAEEAVKPSPGYGTIMSGSFQAEYDDWLHASFPGVDSYVRMYSQLRYMVFSKAPNTNLVVGKRDNLFEPAYIMEYLQISPPGTDEYLNDLFADLTAIREICLQNGKELFIFITPSKAYFYPQDIPDIYYLRAPKNKSELTYYRYLRKLVDSGIPYFDSVGFFESNRGRIEAEMGPLFTKTGTHWSWVSAGEATKALIDELNIITGMRLKEMHVTGRREVLDPVSPDADLYNLMNVMDGRMDRHYYYPIFHFSEAQTSGASGIFIQGGSFMEEPIGFLNGGGVFTKTSFVFQSYAAKHYNMGAEILLHGDFGNLDLNYLLSDIDIILLEVNMAMTGNQGTGFPKYLLDYLKARGFP